MRSATFFNANARGSPWKIQSASVVWFHACIPQDEENTALDTRALNKALAHPIK